MTGALLVDKPAGISSHTVVAKIRRHYGIKRVGHAGTLDPLATGLLIILCGKATRLQSVFLQDTKGYEGVFILGKATETDDLEGAVTKEVHDLKYLDGSTFSEMERRLESAFQGHQQQVPPDFSAIKISGKRSYKLAREGKAITHVSRPIEIESISLRFLDKQRLKYKVVVSKGTYIRALGRDIGTYLGVPACVQSIRRTSTGPYSLDKAIDFDQLLLLNNPGSLLIGMEELVSHLPKIVLDKKGCELIRFGNQSPLQGVELEGGGYEGYCSENIAAIVDKNGSFYGLAQPRITIGVENNNTKHWQVRFIVDK